jgi:hypothetical protein
MPSERHTRDIPKPFQTKSLWALQTLCIRINATTFRDHSAACFWV